MSDALRKRGVAPSQGQAPSVSPARDARAPTEEQQQQQEVDLPVVTLFRFPTVIVLSTFALGCAVQDIMVDQLLSDADRRQHYNMLAALPCTGVDAVAALIAVVVAVHLVMFRLRVPDLISAFILGVLAITRRTQLYPRYLDVQRFTAENTHLSLGKIPSALRGIFAFNLVTIPLLVLLAFVQLYTYAVFISDEGYLLEEEEGANDDGATAAQPKSEQAKKND